MKWEGQRQSDNVEDRRSGGAGLGGFGLGGRGLSLGTVAIALIAGWIFGINPLALLGMMSGGEGPATQPAPAHAPPANDRNAAFVSTVLADTEDVWTKLMQASGSTYQAPKLVLFRGATTTACGQGQAAMGPFYCPADRRVYIDLVFFDTMSRKLGAPGDFAQAYVIAHEVGHHVQNLLGVADQVAARRARGSDAQGNALSVRMELQADCFAGLWAHHSQRSKGWLEQGDIEEAMNAATQIGDDNLQRRTQGTVVPESFTHGSSAQRVGWFRRGFESGSAAKCNALDARELG